MATRGIACKSETFFVNYKKRVNGFRSGRDILINAKGGEKMFNKPRIKGLRIPRILVFILGFFHGKVLKTAVIDEDTGLISSSYVSSKRGQYNEYANLKLQNLENNTKAFRSEKERKRMEEVIKLEQLREITEKELAYKDLTDKNSKREARKNAACRVETNRQVEELRISQAELESKIKSMELHCREELDANTNALYSLLASYAHGALIGERVAIDNCLPRIKYDDAFDLYYQSHQH